MTLAHFGTFDVENYGDLLFPRLLEWRLGGLFPDIVHLSPVGGKPYRDVPVSRTVSEFQESGARVDAVVIGGGNILHADGSTLREYESVAQTAYPSLWLDAAQLASKNNVPLALNSPGVPRRLGRLGRPLMRQVGQRADYLAVRDTFSAGHLHRAGVTNVHVVPDTALEVAMMFGRDAPEALDVSAELHECFDRRYVAVHVNDRYFDGPPAQLARLLDRLSSALDARIVLVGIGPCHGDDEYAEVVSQQMSSDPVVYARPAAVEDIAYVISRSLAYIGSSMHGFITAASYGVPGLLIARHASQHKFHGLLNHIGATSRLTDSWDDAVAHMESDARRNEALQPLSIEGALSAIDRHWTDVRKILTSPHAKRSSFLRLSPRLSRAFSFRDSRLNPWRA